jgi:integrase
MKAQSEHLFRRGQRGTFYLRRRIPLALRDAYPRGKAEFLVSLRTSDESLARERLRAELVALDQQFERMRVKLEGRWKSPGQREVQRVTHLSEQQLQDFAQSWVRMVLETDDHLRQQDLGDDEFDELGQRIASQRKELGQLLARGQSQRVVPAMLNFFKLCGVEAVLPAHEQRQASHAFLQAVVTALDLQQRRQVGEVVATEAVSAPAPVGKTWREVFETWRDYVVDRPKPTTLACNTAWRQLEAFARQHDVLWPAHVSGKLLTALVEHMHKVERLSPKTINERLRKIRAVYRIAVGKDVLERNPATDTLGVKLPKHLQGRNKRRAFTTEELSTLFGSAIFTQHLRSRGQSGEASYWIPLIMFYSGARPEEIAGLMVEDLRHDKSLGWYFHITDLPSMDDEDGLFDADDEGGQETPRETSEPDQRRHLKNAASRRNVPVARQLIELGLLRYSKAVKAGGSVRLFPTLRPDTHGKLSGAHGKFFGRYKRSLGITSPLKTLYSLRHGMKDYLERAQTPSKYLKRALGHTTGDGAVTDGYGSDLPLDIVVGYFGKVQFPDIPALPWQPAEGFVASISGKSAVQGSKKGAKR